MKPTQLTPDEREAKRQEAMKRLGLNKPHLEGAVKAPQPPIPTIPAPTTVPPIQSPVAAKPTEPTPVKASEPITSKEIVPVPVAAPAKPEPKTSPPPVPAAIEQVPHPSPKLKENPITEACRAWKQDPEATRRQLQLTVEGYNRLSHASTMWNLSLTVVLTVLLEKHLPKPTMPYHRHPDLIEGVEYVAKRDKYFADSFDVPEWMNTHKTGLARIPASIIESPYLHWRIKEASIHGLTLSLIADACLLRFLSESPRDYYSLKLLGRRTRKNR